MLHNFNLSALNNVRFPQWFTFSNLCRGHAALDLVLGASILYSVDMTATAFHGSQAAKELFGDDSVTERNQDKVTVRVSESAVGLMLVDIGVLLSVISTSTSAEFQKLTCQCALGIHGLMVAWRLCFQRHVEAVRKDIGGQIFTDVLFASTWGLYLLKLAKDNKN
jgi:hypothetical protein